MKALQEYCEIAYLTKPCKCPICHDDEDMTMIQAGCKYKDVDVSILGLVSTYTTYVVDGNTPLIDLPYVIAETAMVVEAARSRAGLQKSKDKKAKEDQHALLASVGAI